MSLQFTTRISYASEIRQTRETLRPTLLKRPPVALFWMEIFAWCNRFDEKTDTPDSGHARPPQCCYRKSAYQAAWLDSDNKQR